MTHQTNTNERDQLESIRLMETIAKLETTKNELAESERQLRTIFELNPACIKLLAKDGSVMEMNHAGLVMIEADSLEEIKGKPVAHLVAQKYRSAFTEMIDRVFEGNAAELEFEIIGMKGTQRWLDSHAVPLWNGSTTPRALLAISKDVTERKQAQENQAKLQQAINQSHDVIFMTGPDGTITFVNSEFEALYGYKPDEVLGKNPRGLKSGIQPTAAYEPFWKTILSGGTYKGELVNKTKDGRLVDVEVTVDPIFDLDHTITGFVAIQRDITERKRTQVTLRESEERYRRIVETTNEGIWSIDAENRTTFVNSRMASMLGYEVSDMVGKPLFDFMDEEGRLITLRNVELRRRGVSESHDFKFRRSDGSDLWTRISASPLFGNEGSYTGALAMVADITEKRKAEEDLRDSEERYRGFVETAKDVIFTLSTDGLFTSLNPAFETITGWSSDEWIGKSFTSILHPDDLSMAREFFRRNLEGKLFPTYELRIKRKDGQFVVGEFTTSQLAIRGKINGVLGIARDITERKKLEEHLRQIQKMDSIGELAGGIAHDFNNILGIILGYSSMLERAKNMDDHSLQMLGVIKSAVNRGAGVVRQLLTFARKDEESFEALCVTQHVEELVKMFKETFPKTITIETDLQQHLPLILADSNQLHQVLLNLGVNARDAMPDGGTLSFKADIVQGKNLHERIPGAQDVEYLRVCVSDTGIGMDEKTRTRIFEPFFSTKVPGKGTGLGLAVVYGVVKSHHGFIEVESKLGKGTTFCLYFPIHSQNDRAINGQNEHETPIHGGSETILLVEDEESLSDLVKLLLEGKGYSVLVAGDGIKAIEIYRRHHHEIATVISDMGLPKMNGLEVLQKIKGINPKAKMIIASGFIDADLRSKTVELGAVGVIQKPFKPAELLNMLRRAIDGVEPLQPPIG